jgi:hypothetical protein
MATIQATLNITSADATSEALAISQTGAITITNPVQNTSRDTIIAASATVIVPAAKATVTYVYLKNTDATNDLDLAEAATNVSFGTLGPSEWAFFPVKASVGLEITASAGTVVAEYGFWTQ